MHLIILAAGKGSRLKPLTDSVPKCMVKVGGKTILSRVLDCWESLSQEKPVLVGGYKIQEINYDNIILLNNKNYETTNMVQSLMVAEDYFKNGFIMSYGDIFYSSEIIEKLIDANEDINVVVDDDWQPYWEMRFKNPLDDAETLKIYNNKIIEIGKKTKNISDIDSQYIGLIYFRKRGISLLKEYFKNAKEAQKSNNNPFNGPRPFNKMFMTDLLQAIINDGNCINPIRVKRGWFEIDSLNDIKVVENILNYEKK